MTEKNVDEKITFYGTMSMWEKEEYKDRYKYVNILSAEEYECWLKVWMWLHDNSL